MIEVKATVNSKRELGLEVKGHSGADEEGRDIVCAGVSALCFALFNHVTKMEEDAEFIFEKGHAKIFIKHENRIVRELFDMVLNALMIMAEEYPENIKLNVF